MLNEYSVRNDNFFIRPSSLIGCLVTSANNETDLAHFFLICLIHLINKRKIMDFRALM